MAVSINVEGSQTATISTEHTLATVTSAGTYVLVVDLVNLAKGDVLELRIKTKLTSGDTSQLAYDVVYANAQGSLNTYSIPVPSPIEFVATLKQTAGTGRVFIWAVYAL
jgi:hypothetical protein